MNRRILWSLAIAAILAGGSAMAAAQGMGSGMMGSGGMMGSHGPGMMYAAAPATRARPNAPAAGPGYYGMGRNGGYGRYGMGPGMMGGYGGYGMGAGMMGGYGGYGMGPGMMGGYGGYGMGPGMMGGYGHYGMGPGMMYGYGAHALGLSAQQREKIADIWNQAMQKSWPTMGQLREQRFRLARLMHQESPDRAAIDKVYGQMSDLRRKLLNVRLEARQQMLHVLTDEQRKQLRQGFYGDQQ